MNAPPDQSLIEPQITNSVIGAFYAVYNALGFGAPSYDPDAQTESNLTRRNDSEAHTAPNSTPQHDADQHTKF